MLSAGACFVVDTCFASDTCFVASAGACAARGAPSSSSRRGVASSARRVRIAAHGRCDKGVSCVRACWPPCLWLVSWVAGGDVHSMHVSDSCGIRLRRAYGFGCLSWPRTQDGGLGQLPGPGVCVLESLASQVAVSLLAHAALAMRLAFASGASLANAGLFINDGGCQSIALGLLAPKKLCLHIHRRPSPNIFPGVGGSGKFYLPHHPDGRPADLSWVRRGVCMERPFRVRRDDIWRRP